MATDSFSIIRDLRLKARPLLALSSGILLALSFLYPQFFMLPWVAFVPLLFSLQNVNFRQAYQLGLICGLSLSVISSYWINDFVYNLKGYGIPVRMFFSALLWIYSAHLMVILVLVYTWLKRSLGLSDYLLFPALVSASFSAYPLLFSIQLGATQSQFLIALQAIEYTGVYGLDFIIALTNVLAWKLLAKVKDPVPSCIALFVLASWFVFGMYSVVNRQAEEALWTTKKIGIVQSNDLPSINIPPPSDNYSLAYPPEMAMAEKLANDGAEAVIWPEVRFKGYFRESHVGNAFRDQAKTLGVALILQDVERVVVDGSVKKFNTSVFIDSKGLEQDTYRKRKLVAVGEYLPLFSDKPTIKSAFKRTFGEFFSDFSRGQKPEQFLVNGIVFVPLICYEVMFSRFVADSLPKNNEGKVLLVQSSNAWFGDTRQPFQHLSASVLRSVENRLPMVHVVNNGPSAIVLPSGTMIFKSSFNEAGGYLVEMPFSEFSRESIFSRYPNAFVYSLYTFIIFVVFFAICKRLYQGRCIKHVASGLPRNS